MKHDLKTIEDIINVINAENIDNFIIDFKSYLNFNILLKTTQEIVGKENVGISKEDEGVLNWIDDGKTEAHITINII